MRSTPAFFSLSLLTVALVWPDHARSANIVETAVKAGNFDTLVAAVKAADLVAVLSGDGPYTVFAPTDEAFDKLPDGALESLLEPENRTALQEVLMYHVLKGEVSASQASQLRTAATLGGQRLDIGIDNGRLTIDGAGVVGADIKTDNGTIHVIDQVLLPQQSDLIETAVSDGAFKTLAAALKAANLVSVLKEPGPFTVFAPSDSAFAKLPKAMLQGLLEPDRRDKLVALLTYHVVPGRIYASDLLDSQVPTTLEGNEIEASYDEHGLKINDARIIKTDIETANGVIHVIDSVLAIPITASAGRMNAPLSRHARFRARMIITRAIQVGAPAYNNGYVKECADIYVATAKRLLAMTPAPFSEKTRADLEKAVQEAGKMESMDRRAWTMRHALDAAMAALHD